MAKCFLVGFERSLCVIILTAMIFPPDPGFVPCSVLYWKADIPEVSVKGKCFVGIERGLATRGSHVDRT